MDGYRLQLRLFDLIKERTNDEGNWIDEISEVLNLSKSAVYKKINASSSLSLEELSHLLLKYDLNFNQLIRPDAPNISFDFPYMTDQVHSFLDYILPLKQNIELFSRLPNVQVLYTTHELPVFYWFLQRDLCYFKLFAFANTVWELDGYHGEKLSLNNFSGEQVIMKEVDAISERYLGMPCVEFWNQNILSNTLNQIKYFANSGMFETLDDALTVCDRLKEVMEHVKKMAADGKKYPIGQEAQEKHADFILYHNETAHTNNSLCVTSDTVNSVFVTYDSPNFIASTDQELVDYTQSWFDRLRRHSLPVSKDAFRSRNYLFNRIFKMIDFTKSELENLKKSGEAFSI